MCKYIRWMCLLTEQKCQKRFEIKVKIRATGKCREESRWNTSQRVMCPPRPGQSELTNVHLVIRLCITYALKLELLQGLGELLDGSRKICKMRGWECQNRTPCKWNRHWRHMDKTLHMHSRQKKNNILLMQHSHKLTTYQDWQRDWRVVYPTPQKWHSWISKSTCLSTCSRAVKKSKNPRSILRHRICGFGSFLLM